MNLNNDDINQTTREGLKDKLDETIPSHEEQSGEHGASSSVPKQQSKGKWTEEEDHLLKLLVQQHSIINLPEIEKGFNGTRNSKQIRERWVNHLDPSVKKRKFNDEEIEIIEEEFRKNKFKWAFIAKEVPGASPLMVKNYYYNKLRKKISSGGAKENYKLLTLANLASDISQE